ncbi:MAG TPA: hypothetical protein ENF37_03895 [Beggiatoa sp.]|nr:hypothetical protein [Beggiatoa sp.]
MPRVSGLASLASRLWPRVSGLAFLASLRREASRLYWHITFLALRREASRLYWHITFLALRREASRLYWYITFLALICYAEPTGRLTFEPVFYQKKNLGA